MSYVDIHCHILPAVDDGARDLEESVEYAHRLVDEGVRELIATPHVGNPPFRSSQKRSPIASLRFAANFSSATFHCASTPAVSSTLPTQTHSATISLN